MESYGPMILARDITSHEISLKEKITLQVTCVLSSIKLRHTYVLVYTRNPLCSQSSYCITNHLVTQACRRAINNTNPYAFS
ncbi:uncharacterized protein LOC110118887 isoform X3 [Ceratitis capitata]|uniref:uncharacterized protein LOC110118887 isoform X3 n=1 Tax=Ceratitis capitata TaxID=7213 RepID=UPI000A0FEB6D|nr:uncharacterized protein LOC110118887 isoform X3 [Ceratitis capitata]